MGQVLQFRRNDVWLPEATTAMGEAYDTAIGALPHSQSDFFVRERIAKRIMKAAYAGGIDRKQLRQLGLFGFHEGTKGGVLVRDLLPDNTFYQSQPPKDPTEDDEDEEDDVPNCFRYFSGLLERLRSFETPS